jgi:AmmeMemoRadiSam system protein B/AmmeMemoRadiSam system protein A
MRILQQGDSGRLGVSRNRMQQILSAALACACLLASSIACAAPEAGANEERVRPPAVAGQFYPDDPAKLEAAVQAFLSAAEPPAGPRPVAIVAPHAGYIYSGQIAADAYRQAVGHEYDLVVILGANHTSGMFAGVTVYDGKGYRTPLGLAEIDRDVTARLIAADDSFRFSRSVHEREHSVEVQVPFVQVLFPGVKIVTAIVARPDIDLCTRFGRALAETIKDRRALIVASSDLSHYPAYDEGVTADLATLEAMTWIHPAKLQAAIRKRMAARVKNLSTCACGEAPVLAALEAARRLGANHARIVSYANSGDTALGDLSRIVGYGAVALTARDGEAGAEPVDRTPGWYPSVSDHEGELSEAEGRQLLEFARASIRHHLDTGTAPLARHLPPALWRKQGVFVTLKKQGHLRGCIGHRAADRPLGQVVGSMALQAAFNDRRFRPVTADELDQIEIEISLLSPLARVESPEKIVVGRDGVLLSKQGRGAIYLPEVAVEQGWDREQMLGQLCRKGGLPVDAWREGAELYTFQSVVLHESRP